MDIAVPTSRVKDAHALRAPPLYRRMVHVLVGGPGGCERRAHVGSPERPLPRGGESLPCSLRRDEDWGETVEAPA
jgi:hypothetical protein